jgi:8-oxo-dGTP diphosphatase
VSQAYQPNRSRVPCGTCLILRDPIGRVFMIRRTGAHGEGTWSFPGGWIEPGEEPARAAAREAWEEIGVNIVEKDIYFVGYTADRHPEGMFGITLWFETSAWIGEPRNTNPHRITDGRWFDPDEKDGLPTPLFTPVLEGMRRGLLP